MSQATIFCVNQKQEERVISEEVLPYAFVHFTILFEEHQF